MTTENEEVDESADDESAAGHVGVDHDEDNEIVDVDENENPDDDTVDRPYRQFAILVEALR